MFGQVFLVEEFKVTVYAQKSNILYQLLNYDLLQTSSMRKFAFKLYEEAVI